MIATTKKLMTVEEFLRLPENGNERWLIQGQLHEIPSEKPMTVRNRFHSRLLMKMGTELEMWLRTQPSPKGGIFGGEAGFLLRRNPDTIVGIDIAYVDSPTLSKQTNETTLIDGVPILAIEIMSPSDRREDLTAKIREYLSVGVAYVWTVDPDFKYITAYRPNENPQLYTLDSEITAEPQLPRLRIQINSLFEE
jgi:Uma2 family endonuclease